MEKCITIYYSESTDKTIIRESKYFKESVPCLRADVVQDFYNEYFEVENE